ncbi:hypothetical protein ACFOLF_17405 [Paenibacillus sepulcri]|uniref:Lipoprotein n=1 Tax=Paenibacillus sepulcri TaxID=359917 RepID=A0ABS7BX41_9BACL|nr:hypothetical protein [Paenibacillus sepulcri]
MKRIKTGFIVLLAVMMVAVAGCSKGKPPKEAVTSALTNMQEAKSMSFKGTFGIDNVTLPDSAAMDNTNAAVASGVVNFLKGATINMNGVIQTDPQHAEFTLDMALGSEDMKFNMKIPIIVTDEKVWVKVPTIPGFPIPETIAGKFVEIDVKKLAEEQGGAAMPDAATIQKMSQDMMKTTLDNFDEKTYFSEPKAGDIKWLPEDYKADQFVRFSINPQNFETAITTVIEKVAPQIIDLILNNEAYMKTLQTSKEDLERAKAELEGKEEGEVKDAIAEVKKSLKVNEFTLTSGIKDDYLTYQDMTMNMDFIDEADTTKLAAHMFMTYADINKDVTFEYGIPTDAIPVEQLQELLVPQGLGDMSGIEELPDSTKGL